MATYTEQGITWIRQVEGRESPKAGEIAVYWPYAQFTDILVNDEAAQNGTYESKCASGELELGEFIS